jgi:hypothetical protein
MTNYRAFEDHHGFIKFFISTDAEFDAVVSGLERLKGSETWGARAADLEYRFLRAFDGLYSHKLPAKLEEGEVLPEPKCLMDEFINGLRADDYYFKPCDQMTFRKVHDECIRFFKEIRDFYDVRVKDDRNDYSKKK